MDEAYYTQTELPESNARTTVEHFNNVMGLYNVSSFSVPEIHLIVEILKLETITYYPTIPPLSILHDTKNQISYMYLNNTWNKM